MENIIFKASKDKLTVMFNEQESFEKLKADFTQKLQSSMNFFIGSKKTYVEFKSNSLSRPQQLTLLDIILNETGINFSLFEPIKNSEEKNISANEMKSMLHKTSLRSGQFIHYKGNVIVLGDINPGAEIIAGGNIIVMGTIKGLVYAGCAGNKNCIITALSLLPVQIRIADIITYLPDNEIVTKPSYAYITDDKLYISPLQ